MPGNWETTLETMKALEGFGGHITHAQFHSYGGGDADENTFNSKVIPLADYVNSHPNLTIDVGQVLFGETTSMTGDGPLGYFLSKVYGGKWFSSDTEMESGCGITPIKYKNKSLVHALQWRSPEKLAKVKDAVVKAQAAGEKPRLRGRESCLFLEVGGTEDEPEVCVQI